MNTLFQWPDKPDILDEHEIIRLTGCTTSEEQVHWLASRAWIYEKTASGQPIVSRLYFNLRMAGIEACIEPVGEWQ